MKARTVASIDLIPAAQWNALALAGDPFVRHEFLLALERTRCVGAAAGWTPNHLIMEDGERLLQCYLGLRQRLTSVPVLRASRSHCQE